ncbi:hypothetical protein CLDAP_18460 [Caldilinea aerophila DSM 14535 = NBRC 104270]|uniref:Uncharacterized protein n=1 Tax=Caldilinea aerophila (strain DSM 14535 / JCM 11387 / NBRC 104270 / STL-6-O1) TaxID=926550 RepID=I0I3P8_CALAS|nr:hypothetical protein CLDAP_18460 [Caldilinea aerophila DSM 14535 = NBRC 104270]
MLYLNLENDGSETRHRRTCQDDTCSDFRQVGEWDVWELGLNRISQNFVVDPSCNSV